MKTTMKKSVARVITMALVLVMMLSLVVPTMAAELSAAKGLDEVKYGVFKFNTRFEMPAYGAGFARAGRGTAFLINDEYIVTAAHCVKLTENDVNPYGYTLYEENKRLNLLKSEVTYSVTVERDMTVGATLVTMSESMDFAILKLDQKIPTRKYLTLRNSKDVKAAEQVYSIGFPSFYDGQQLDNTYTMDDVTVKSGVISKTQGLQEWSYADLYQDADGKLYQVITQSCKGDVLSTTCNISGGDSGGPLVDSNGYVIGVSIAGRDESASENFYTAAAIDQIMRACDNLGIEYFTDQTAAPAETQPAVVETQAHATEPVVTEPPVTEPPATQPPVVETQPSVVQKEEPGINMTTILIVAAVAVVAVIVVIIIIMSKGKKNQQQPVYAGATGSFTPQTNTYTATMGAGETTVLGGDAGATTVLSRGGSLIRKRTNETIVINAERFIIGRERKTANYCVADNSSVSRSHVTLITRGGMVFLMDMNAANGTFVNGVKVMPNQEVALKNGDKIKLADEEFEFRA